MKSDGTVRLNLVSFQVVDQLLDPKPVFRPADYDLYSSDERALRREWDEQTRDLVRQGSLEISKRGLP